MKYCILACLEDLTHLVTTIIDEVLHRTAPGSRGEDET